MDPTVGVILRGALALLFASAAVHKLRDVERFRMAVDGYQLLPPLWSVPFGAALIALEIGIAAGLCLPPVAPVAGIAAAGLLALYGVAIGVNLARGRRHIDCGCGGPAARQTISGELVVRNSGLAVAALMGVWPATARAMTWVDWLTALAGVAVVALLYMAAAQLQSVRRHSADAFDAREVTGNA